MYIDFGHSTFRTLSYDYYKGTPVHLAIEIMAFKSSFSDWKFQEPQNMAPSIHGLTPTSLLESASQDPMHICLHTSKVMQCFYALEPHWDDRSDEVSTGSRKLNPKAKWNSVKPRTLDAS